MWSLHKPTKPERLYVDFDGFFASCEEQADPRLYGRPVGVIPFRDARNSCVIASNAKAKSFGVKTGISIAKARWLCPQIALVPQRPDLYVRTQQRVVVAVLSVLPIDVICSIDELAAVLEDRDCPEETAGRIKQRVREAVGKHITCSIGCAPNRWLAKIAADLDKPDGLTVLGPSDLPGRLLNIGLEELPGVGRRMRARLEQAGLSTVGGLVEQQPRPVVLDLGQCGRPRGSGTRSMATMWNRRRPGGTQSATAGCYPRSSVAFRPLGGWRGNWQ